MNYTLNDITEQIIQCKNNQDRILVAIAGPPGSGKSTLAEQLNDALSQRSISSCVMPMDGFHLDNQVLKERGEINRKGAQHTFDAHGFVAAIERIYANEHRVYVPVFDRTRDIAIAGVQEIASEHGIVLIEGNYLFLREEPWANLQNFVSMRLFLKPEMNTIEQRILERWSQAGLDQNTIDQRTYGNDLPNARYVLDHSDLNNATIITRWT